MLYSYVIQHFNTWELWTQDGVSQNTAPVTPAPQRPPKIGVFWVLKQDCFRSTFSHCAIDRFSWISWIDRWNTDCQRCSELRPQAAPAKATGGRQDYHDFEVPLLTMLLVLASQALTDWTRWFVLFAVVRYRQDGTIASSATVPSSMDC